jgi:hypothetical protein
VARIKQDLVGELKEAPDGTKELASTRLRIATSVQVGTADISDQERVAGEDEPRLFSSPPPIGNEEGVVCGRMPRRGQSANDRVSEIDDFAVTEGGMGELDSCSGWEVRGRSCCLDECREPRDVVGLNVCLEDGGDWGTGPLSRLQVLVEKLDVRIDDGEL